MVLGIEICLLIYFTYVSFYSFVLAIAALFFRSPPSSFAPDKSKIAILIPAYKEDNVIVSVAREALLQNYPREKFEVVVIADSLRSTTLQGLRAMSVTVVEVSFANSTKVNSLKRAMESIGDDYDYALILDADNVMEPNCLEKLNAMLASGMEAIQAERTPKNEINSMSILDGFSERINNFIYRQGHVAIGLSCSLIGSGMIFRYHLLREIISSLDSVGGFDRELELALIRRGVKIYYAKGVLVYDEKVESTEVFERQRRRWLSSQFIYLTKYFREGCIALMKGHMSMFNSAILKNIQLPRLINLGLLVVLSVLTFLLREYLTFKYYPWIILLIVNVAAIMLAIPLQLYNRKMFRSMLILPKVFIKMFNLLFKLKGANKRFIHTPHGVSNVPANKKED